MAKQIEEPRAVLYPVPVVLVSSADAEGKPNIITVVCVGMACGKPPMISIGIHPWTYSHSLIEASGEFVVNMPTAAIVEAVDYCGRVSGRDEDKFAGARLTALSASKVKAALIKECPVNLECVVKHTLRLGVHDLFVGEVVATHLDETLRDADGKVQGEKCDPLAYLYPAGEYWTLGKALGGYGFTKPAE